MNQVYLRRLPVARSSHRSDETTLIGRRLRVVFDPKPGDEPCYLLSVAEYKHLTTPDDNSTEPSPWPCIKPDAAVIKEAPSE